MDITWEQAMAISGAAFATSMGRVNIEAIRSNETLFAMIGLTLGDWIRFPTSKSFIYCLKIPIEYEVRKSHIAPGVLAAVIWILLCVGTNLYNQYPWTAYLILVGYLVIRPLSH